MSLINRFLELLQNTFDEFDSPNYRLTNVIRKEIRIARLRSDYDNLLWIEEEMLSQENKQASSILERGKRSHYSINEFNIF